VVDDVDSARRSLACCRAATLSPTTARRSQARYTSGFWSCGAGTRPTTGNISQSFAWSVRWSDRRVGRIDSAEAIESPAALGGPNVKPEISAGHALSTDQEHRRGASQDAFSKEQNPIRRVLDFLCPVSGIVPDHAGLQVEARLVTACLPAGGHGWSQKRPRPASPSSTQPEAERVAGLPAALRPSDPLPTLSELDLMIEFEGSVVLQVASREYITEVNVLLQV